LFYELIVETLTVYLIVLCFKTENTIFMKLFVLLLIPFSYLTTFGQAFKFEKNIDDFYHQYFHDVVEIADTFYVLMERPNYGQTYELRKYDKNGTHYLTKVIQVESDISVSTETRKMKMKAVTDGTLLFYGINDAMGGGDLPSGVYFNFIMKCDTEGNQIWIQRFYDEDLQDFNSSLEISLLPEGEILFKEQITNQLSKLHKLSDSGDILDSFDISSHAEGLFSTFSTYSYVKIMDSTLSLYSNQLEQEIEFNELLNSILPISNDSLLLLSKNKLRVLNSSLEEIKLIDFPENYMLFEPKFEENNKLSLLFEKTDTLGIGIIFLDSLYNVISIHFIRDTNLSYDQVVYSDVHVLALKNSRVYELETFAHGIRMQFYKLDEEEAFNYVTDLELVDISILDHNITSSYVNPGFIYRISVELELMLVNRGQDTIQKFKLREFQDMMTSSGFLTTFTLPIENLFLLPGDTLYHYSGWTSFGKQVYTSTNNFNYQCCVYTTAPNDRMDKNYRDNHACKYISGTLNTEKLSFDEVTFFPNPASNELFVYNQSETEMLYEISDLTGRIVLPQSVLTNHTIDVSFLPSSSYFIRFISENGQTIHKIIVER
jgi:hypothetical protein